MCRIVRDIDWGQGPKPFALEFSLTVTRWGFAGEALHPVIRNQTRSGAVTDLRVWFASGTVTNTYTTHLEITPRDWTWPGLMEIFTVPDAASEYPEWHEGRRHSYTLWLPATPPSTTSTCEIT